TEETTRWRKDRNPVPYRCCRICETLREQVEGPGLSDRDMIKVKEAFRRRLTCNQIKKLVDLSQFYRERRRNPEFEALAQLWLVGHGERQAKRTSATRAKQRYEKVDALVPKKLAIDARLEIISMIFVALGDRKYRGKPFCLRALAANIKNFVADYNK